MNKYDPPMFIYSIMIMIIMNLNSFIIDDMHMKTFGQALEAQYYSEGTWWLYLPWSVRSSVRCYGIEALPKIACEP